MCRSHTGHSVHSDDSPAIQRSAVGHPPGCSGMDVAIARGRMRVDGALLGFGSLCLAFLSVHAGDHANLDPRRPLRIEDAYAIAHKEWSIEGGAGFRIERKGTDQGILDAEVLYGLFPNTQVGLGTSILTHASAVHDSERSGDIHFSALYNFNQETVSLPAFALRATVDFPTGVDSEGVDAEIKIIATKSVEGIPLHLNVSYLFVGDPAAGERDGRYRVAAGASFPVGGSTHTRTTLILDLYVEESVEKLEPDVFGMEIGARYQLAYRTVLDAGIGTQWIGPKDRSDLYITVGVSVSF